MTENKISQENKGNKVIVTVLGEDKVGIIASIATILAECSANILDISQTILQDVFTMVMVVDITRCNVDFLELNDRLEKKGKELGVQVRTQREDVFKFMHRI